MELLEACADGDLSAVSALLQGGAAADAVSSDPQTTPLLEAVKNATGTAEHTAIVKLLLKASADPDRVPVSGPTGEPPGDSALQRASAEGFLVPGSRHHPSRSCPRAPAMGRPRASRPTPC